MRRKNYIGSIKTKCLICEKEFTTFISDKRKYCSMACYHKSPTRGKRPKNRIEKICAFCSKKFERAVSNFSKEAKNHFCCHKCSADWWAINGLHGENHPHWTGGYFPKEYKEDWENIKKEIKKRANNKCEKCGGVHRTMDVHHTIPIRLKVDIKIANHLDNLLFLCRPCHIREDMILRGRYPHQKEIVA